MVWREKRSPVASFMLLAAIQAYQREPVLVRFGWPWTFLEVLGGCEEALCAIGAGREWFDRVLLVVLLVLPQRQAQDPELDGPS